MSQRHPPEWPPHRPQQAAALRISGISHVLLDIEGTTCPVSFVADTLFPYASRKLPELLESRRLDPQVQQLILEAHQAWREDPDPEAQRLRRQAPGAVAIYLQELIRQDRKLAPLKELQGVIWAEGYRQGELVAPLFPDVPAALQSWNQQGLMLASYSSGSVAAQQLLYGHCQAGDLRALFCHWFDTRTGPKQQSSSYRKVAEAMAVAPARVLFISDALAELEAAHTAGMPVLFSDRPGNPARRGGPYRCVRHYGELVLEP